MTICPQCCHSLRGLDGLPSELHGPFTAAVTCPECGQVIPAGARVVVGAADAPSVGGRLHGRSTAGYLAIVFSIVPAYSFARGFLQDPGLGFIMSSLWTLAYLACIGVILYQCYASYVRVTGMSDPRAITERIRRKVRWLVRPGALEVFAPAATGARSRVFPADSLRAILALPARTRRSVQGQVVDLTARLDGIGGAATSMFVVTDRRPAQLADDLLAAVCDASGSDAQSTAANPWQLGADRIELTGSPFEPRLLNDVRLSRSTVRRLWLVPLVLFGIAFSIPLARSTDGISMLAFVLAILSLPAVAILAIYTRYRASPSRWIATPGELRIERYTRLVPFLGPSVRRLRLPAFSGVQAVEFEGAFVLQACKGARSVPCALLTLDGLRGRNPAELAAALNEMVRRHG